MIRDPLPFRGDPLSRIGTVMLAVLLSAGLVGSVSDLFGDPTRLVAAPLRSPGAEQLLGTDNLGRSVLARTVAAIQQSVLLASFGVLLSIVLGTALGMIAGYFRGFTDECVSRLSDTLYSFPAIVMAILISALVRPGSSSAIAVVVLVTLPIIIRMIRAATMTVAVRDHVIQAHLMGAGAFYILIAHILPNILGVIVVQAAYSISFGMILESGISFLGLGVQPPNASLGSLVYEGRPYMRVAPWLVIVPGTVLMLTILSINLVGDGMRRRVDFELVE
jgi:peptide/nickel transport system permease protein